jgi:uroporphyrinogen decarboxylase
MTPRERVIAALRREQPDKVPRDMGFTPAIEQMLKEKTGAADLIEHFGVEMRFVGPAETTRDTEGYRRYYRDLKEGSTLDEYGVAYEPGDFHHFTHTVAPMRHFASLREFEAYPMPDVMADYRYDGVAEKIADLKARDLFCVGWVGHFFETVWHMRGMDRFMMDMIEAPEFAGFLVERITEMRVDAARRLAGLGADMLQFGDDVGMQTGMMMSPALWRRWFKPNLAKAIAAAKEANPLVFIWYHSDGDISAIVPELIEAGIDILNPVQPECMDPAKLKRAYGDRLSFWGTIGTQTTMPFGTPDEVKRVVRERIRTVGKGGGLVLAPTHVLEPEVPYENIIAFVEAIEEEAAERRQQ